MAETPTPTQLRNAAENLLAGKTTELTDNPGLYDKNPFFDGVSCYDGNFATTWWARGTPQEKALFALFLAEALERGILL